MPLSPEQTKDLVDELNVLCDEQTTALGDAVYFQMSPEAASECDKRRARITQIRILLFGTHVIR